MNKNQRKLEKRKKALKSLIKLVSNPEHVLIIHYSCEGFEKIPEFESQRIISIAIRNMASGQTTSFSIHQIAELKNIPYDAIDQRYNELEKLMLDEYFVFVGKHEGYKWLHWNMRNSNFGFAALEHRHKVLGGSPIQIQDSLRNDLSRLLTAIYGRSYIGHPRLMNITKKNNISKLGLLSGEEEAKMFDAKEYLKVYRSTIAKVGLISYIAQLAADGDLKTNTKLIDIYGLSFLAAMEVIKEHWIISLISLIAAIATILFLVLEYFNK